MPISPESSYCLDGSVMSLRMTPDIAFGAQAGRIDVDAIIDQGANATHPSFVESVTRDVLWWRGGEPSKVSRWLMAIVALTGSEEVMREFLWSITGPVAEHYLCRRGYPPPCDIAGKIIPRKPLEVAIPSIQSLRLPYVTIAQAMGDADLMRYVGLLKGQHARCVEAFKETPYADMESWITRFAEAGHDGPEAVEASVAPARPKVNRRKLRQARKAVWRGVRSMNAIVAPNAYKAFVSGDGFVIAGRLFDYHVSKKSSLLQHSLVPDDTHVPYHLNLRNKDGADLGSGCIVFAATPVLDQVIALALHVRDREAELDLVRTTRWLRVTQAGMADEAFGGLRQRQPSVATDMLELFEAMHRVDERVWRRRKRIMDAIAPNAITALSQLTGIPRPVYQYMSNPGPLNGLMACLDTRFRACVDLMARS